MKQIFDVLIIGAGQSGLATAYLLQKKGARSFVLVDSNARIGDSWRKRYDSLRLLTPNSENSLPGLLLKQPKHYATKNEYGDYLEIYAKIFGFTIEPSTTITKLSLKNGIFVAGTKGKQLFARNVVIATGPFQKPYIPFTIKGNKKGVSYMHSASYKNPKQISKGKVLVAGAGNSGAQIASELSITHDVVLASKRRIFFSNRYDIFYRIAALMLPAKQVRKIVDLLSVRKIYVPSLEGLLKDKRVVLKSEVTSIVEGRVQFADGTSDSFTSIIFATGFTFDFNWIYIREAFDKNHKPIVNKGISAIDGLYLIYYEKDYGFIRDLATRVEYIADILGKRL